MKIEKYKFWHKNSIHAQAKHLVLNCFDKANYNLDRYLIFHFDTWEVIDKLCFTITCFETEQEALDHSLDKIAETKDINQTKLF